MTPITLLPKIFSRTQYVDQVKSIDNNLLFFKLKLLILRQ